MLSGPKLTLFRNDGLGNMSEETQLTHDSCNVWAFANIDNDTYPDVLCGPNFITYYLGQLYWMKNMNGERLVMHITPKS